MESFGHLREILELLENRFDLVGEPLELLVDISEAFNQSACFGDLLTVPLLALAFGTRS